MTLSSLKINIIIAETPLPVAAPFFGAGLGLMGSACQTQKAEERRFDRSRLI